MNAPVPSSNERQIKEQTLRLLQRMQAKLTAAESRMSAPIAIVGMGCRFPLGDTPDALWADLQAGRDGVATVPAERWTAAAGAAGHGAFLRDIDRFDAAFFGISPREAVAMDPQQRIVLEVAWEALENAGIAADRLEATRTGVYLGCCTADYARLGDADAQASDGYAATGGAPGVAAGRIAYTLGFNGPALVVDTACSSSLVALHLAVQGLRAGDCTVALAGGVNLTLLPQGAATLDHLQMLSPDGHCKAFDASADGFVRGEGCGVVVLKRLSDAEAGGDRVLAVIRGTAVNQDGRSAGLTAPNGPAQEAVIRAALANGGLSPDAVDAIEAHGTGTSLGDPIEMHALASVFAGRSKPLRVGSVKTNIGHTEAAAGIAGLIKAVLMLRHQAVPASLHFKTLNPHIDLGGVPIEVPTTSTAAELGCVGVSSFGFSGTNAHVVLERVPAETPSAPATGPAQLFISARTPAALRELVGRYRGLLDAGMPFADLCHSASVGRARLPWWICVDHPDKLLSAEPSDAPPPELQQTTGRRVDLPTYPFQRQRYWLDESEQLPGRRLAHAGDAPLFEVTVLPGSPRVADHRVRGEPLLPAADMVERLRAAAEVTGQGTALVDVSFDRPLPVPTPRTIQVVAGTPLALFSRDSEAWQRHASATPAPRQESPTVDLATLRRHCSEPLDTAAYARWLRETGLEYGPYYDCIDSLFRGPSQALARLKPAPYIALLDTALRIAGAIHFGSGGAARLPASIARYERGRNPAGEVWAYAEVVEESGGVSVIDIRLIDGSGAAIAVIERLRLASAASVGGWHGWLHATRWTEAPSPFTVIRSLREGLGDTSVLEAALNAAAGAYAREALASVTEAEVASRHKRLWQHLPRLAALPQGASLPQGPESALLSRCGAALADVLRGKTDPMSLLFADGDAAGIYRDAAAYRAANETMAALAVAILPPTGRVRVLEVGAGTGGTTGAVLASLDTRRTDYWFTDLSPTLVAQARGKFAAERFAVFDLERPLAGQDVPANAFDLVIAANVLHATADLGTTLDHLLATLAPQGRLLLLETAPPGRKDQPAGWIDLVFGLTEGWWRFSDKALRPDYPLLQLDDWVALLQSKGLEVEALSLPGHSVLLAQRAEPLRVHRDAGGSAADRCAALLDTIGSLKPGETRLILLTDGAIGPAVTDPAAATLWGMMRTLRLERPELELRCVDGPRSDWDRALTAERLTAEPEIVLADGARFVPSLAAAEDGGAALSLNADAWYLVTGALGGLGRFITEWLVRHGARRLVLSGRTAETTAWIDRIRETGIAIRVEAGDLADAAAVQALIARLPPLGGIVHAAGTLDDATLAQAKAQQFRKVLAPKVDAALALDAAFPDVELFVMFSSAVGLFGQVGQATHVAASLGLDALAAARRRRGRSAVSLGWGLWRDSGSSTQRTALAQRMAAQGLGTISNDGAAAVLDWALTTPEAAVAVLPVDRTRFLASFGAARPPASTRAWQIDRPRSTGTVTPASPATGRATPQDGALIDLVSQEAAAVLGYPPGETLPRTANLFDLGLDSLMAVELRNRLQTRLDGRPLSATLLFDFSTIDALCAHLGGETAAVRPTASAADAGAPIAIVGIGCRFPGGGEDPEQFWQALARGQDGIIERPERPDASVLDGAAARAGYLRDVAGFDPTFFGIAPREAVFMDPQHRLLLEVTWEALESALLPPDTLSGTSTGVFVGMCNYDYAQFAANAEGADGYAGIGGAPSIAAGRIAYLLGLTGPAMVLDTACSSSLVAVHLAVRALRAGECTVALAGGVNLTLGSGTTTALEGLQMLSPDGHCKAFDASADGFVRGEGCGVVVLKRLTDAEAAGDRVLAVIRGTSVNQDGRSAGLTAPNGPAQEAVIRAALADAGLSPDAVDAIEAHGTGTSLGDPIEMHALAAVFAGRSKPLRVGSVKTNIGHAEAAAGIAGLIKAVLMLRHQVVPASLHFKTLNPHIDLAGVPIEVPTASTASELDCVGVSSFGFSGTNAHVVLERAPTEAPIAQNAEPGQLFISARTPAALRELIGRYQTLLDAGVQFADLCHSAAVGRARLPWWICVDHPDKLLTAEPSDAPRPELPPTTGRRIDLPTYPFQRQRYWAQPRKTSAARAKGRHPLLGRRVRSGLAQTIHEALLSPNDPAWLADHAVNGKAVMPAAGLVEMMLAATPSEAPIELSDVAFRQMLIPDERPLVQTIVDPGAGTVRIVAAPDEDDVDFVTIAEARWRTTVAIPAAPSQPAGALRTVDLDALYVQFAEAGLAYGPSFRVLRSLAGGGQMAVADLPPGKSGWRLDPCILDAAWQSLAAALPEDSKEARVPVGVDRFVWIGGTPARSVLHLRTPDRAEVALIDSTGKVVAWCEGLRLATVACPSDAMLSDTVWQDAPQGTETPTWIDCRNDTGAETACWRVLSAFRAAGDGGARLAVLGRRATTAGGTVPLPAQAALVGLMASLARERPELRPLLLDLEGDVPPAVPASSDHTVLAYRDGKLLAPQLVARSLVANPGTPFSLTRASSNTLDDLRWAPAARRTPGVGEVEIEVATAGINFRDVMNLLGVYPGDGGAPGVECAGTVTAVGSGVTGVAPGDVVVAIAPASFASHVIADANLVCRIPLSLDWRRVAAQPVALLTARLALDDVAHLQKGQRILIHAATGGVGLATVALAKARGAVIVASAGNPAKRAHLRALGITEIYDSRTLDFARCAPVDIVLNSLTGPAIPAGLKALKPGCLFLELGKAELWSRQQVDAVRRDVRYEVVALDRLILDEPRRVGAMLRDSIAGLATEPRLPVELHPFADITGALRVLQGARHIGKLALNRTRFRGDATYVISGGTGAIGRELSAWMVEQGARHLFLLTRRPVEVQIARATVRTEVVDLGDAAAVRLALESATPAIKGVFHLAAELHDATAATMTRAQLDAAFGAKLHGAESLDSATRGLPLDHFVLFGSLAGRLGSAGQANYAAANAALEAIVASRRAGGRAATLIDWGAWRGLGMARDLEGPGLDARTALAAMDVALSSDVPRMAISAGTRADSAATAAFAKRLEAAVGNNAKREVLEDLVETLVRRILGLGELPLERHRPFAELGLDSLMAVELRNALGAAIGRVLPTSLVFDHPTADALCTYLAVELGLAVPPAPTVVSLPIHAVAPASPEPAPIDDLADDDALALLERKLSHAGY
jgi:acyl transferase domain-containing protein/NADPH:quinone reductase-like Zn-dependent oxidoreductase/acyl carrier protein